MVKIAIFFAFLFCNTLPQTIYKKIQPINLSSLVWEDEEWPNEPFSAYLKRCLDYQLHPQEIKKRRIVFKLFDELSCDKEIGHNALYDMATAQDLGLLAGKESKDPYIAQLIDRTKTQFGKVFLYGLLANPITNIETLKRRQKIIHYFLEHPSFFSRFNDLFDQFGQTENMVLSLWAQDGFLTSTHRHYYSFPILKKLNDKLNNSSVSLELKSLLDHQARLVWLGTGILAALILPIYGLSKITSSTLPEYIEDIAQPLQGSGGRLLALFASRKNKFISGIAAITAGISCVFFCKEDYDWVIDNFLLDRCLHHKMILISQFYNTLSQVIMLLESEPEFVQLCPAAQELITSMNAIKYQEKMKKFFDYCSSATFKGEPSFIANQGNVLAAFRLVYEVKKVIEPFLLTLGELDAYSSCARLYNEFEGKRARFCFATYTCNETPKILIEDLWNPFINPEKVITNSIHLLGPQKRNMIITGPNAGGKSTIIKAVPINLILAQSIGLMAANYGEITPFHSIATYLNITDDIAAGNSLFKAQVLRAQEMVSLIEKTPSGQFSFVALDEMFNGTSAKESMATAYSVVKHIAGFDNNICIVATHFPLLTKLAADNPAFENYKVSVQVNNNIIFYPFKLEKGISTQHVALDILKQEGYAGTIIEQASQILATVV